MSLYDSEIWVKDIDRVIEANPCISSLSGKSVMITGINGLVCSAIADVLIRYNENHNPQVAIFAAGRSEKRIRERFGKYSEKSYFHFIQYDATTPFFGCNLTVDYIIHGASNSSPDRITKEPVETILSNIVGLNALLSYAKKRGTKRLLYISTSEVYGAKEDSEPFREDQYGFIDLLKPRNSYSVGKRAAETLCVSYSDEYDVESVIIRPGHIYGPSATKADKHVSSQWAYDAARGEDIVMKSEGMQLRSYCYCLDAATAILTALIKGENNHAYNISNPDSVISIKEMAQALADSAGVQVKMGLPTDDERKGFNPMSNSSLDSTSLINLGWKGVFNDTEGFGHTVQILRDIL